MPAPVRLSRTAATQVRFGGTAVTAIFGPVLGGMIVNPPTAASQGVPAVEPLYLDLVAEATVGESDTTFALQPGQSFTVLPNQAGNVSVNARTNGHRFSGFVAQPPPPFPPTPQPGSFPPAGPTTLTKTIPSYLYQEYADDDDLQAFVGSYNSLAQAFVDWFNAAGLPFYPQLSGALLDWVAQGLYGMTRPSLASGLNADVGPLNTYVLNTLALNERKKVGPSNVAVTDDDTFKRIMTWNFYKGDGNVLNVRWLKRRIMRLLTVADGLGGAIDQTYAISVTFGAGGAVSIRIAQGSRIVLGGALFNRFGLNEQAFNGIETRFIPGPNPLPHQAVLKEAVESGVLQLPFQYKFVVSV